MWDNAVAPIRSFSLPVAIREGDNLNEITAPSFPAPPSHVAASHPLLMPHNDVPGLGSSMTTRVHRTGRRGGTYRYNPSTQTLHVHYSSMAGGLRHPPSLLQRLLGEGASEVLQVPGTGGAPATRFHFITNDDVRFLPRPEEDYMDDVYHLESMEEESSGEGALCTVPSALARWREESRVLDGESMHDCLTVLKPEIISTLESIRDEELAERRERRKKAAEEEQAKKEEASYMKKIKPHKKLFDVKTVREEDGGESTATPPEQAPPTEQAPPPSMQAPLTSGAITTPSAAETATSSMEV